MPSHRAIHVGTAGWSIASQYAERFQESGTHLERYARTMTAVEINTSFYRPHQRKTYERWASSTPDCFQFAVKVPRQLTHIQRLADAEEGLDRFANEIAGLGQKLGVVLVQLPPSLKFDAPVAASFFEALASRTEANIAFEPRHPTWFVDEAEAFLARRGIARVAADPAPASGAANPWRMAWPGLLPAARFATHVLLGLSRRLPRPAFF